MAKQEIKINIQNLVGSLVIVNTSKEETAEEILKAVNEALLSAVKSSAESQQ